MNQMNNNLDAIVQERLAATAMYEDLMDANASVRLPLATALRIVNNPIFESSMVPICTVDSHKGTVPSATYTGVIGMTAMVRVKQNKLGEYTFGLCNASAWAQGERSGAVGKNTPKEVFLTSTTKNGTRSHNGLPVITPDYLMYLGFYGRGENINTKAYYQKPYHPRDKGLRETSKYALNPLFGPSAYKSDYTASDKRQGNHTTWTKELQQQILEGLVANKGSLLSLEQPLELFIYGLVSVVHIIPTNDKYSGTNPNNKHDGTISMNVSIGRVFARTISTRVEKLFEPDAYTSPQRLNKGYPGIEPNMRDLRKSAFYQSVDMAALRSSVEAEFGSQAQATSFGPDDAVKAAANAIKAEAKANPKAVERKPVVVEKQERIEGRVYATPDEVPSCVYDPDEQTVFINGVAISEIAKEQPALAKEEKVEARPPVAAPKPEAYQRNKGRRGKSTTENDKYGLSSSSASAPEPEVTAAAPIPEPTKEGATSAPITSAEATPEQKAHIASFTDATPAAFVDYGIPEDEDDSFVLS